MIPNADSEALMEERLKHLRWMESAGWYDLADFWRRYWHLPPNDSSQAPS